MVNLFDSFWRRRADDLYLKGWDDHWNARGQAYAAELVSQFVIAQNRLGGSNPEARTNQSVTEQR